MKLKSRLDWEMVRDRAKAVLVFDPENKGASELLGGAESSTRTRYGHAEPALELLWTY